MAWISLLVVDGVILLFATIGAAVRRRSPELAAISYRAAMQQPKAAVGMGVAWLSARIPRGVLATALVLAPLLLACVALSFGDHA